MDRNDLRARLEKLNRGGLGASITTGDRLGAPRADKARPRDLESLVAGRVAGAGDQTFYLIERRGNPDWQTAVESSAWLDKVLSASLVPRVDALEDLQAAAEAGARDLLFMDLETCGFAGTPVFLIGAMYIDDGNFVVEQMLARSYAEEAAILQHFASLLASRPHLVTFNGKSFDWPFVADRAAVSRVPLHPPAGHVDLLHVCRRRFKTILPDCKLQTLERFVCGRRRVDDIPGSEIPTAYHEFVQTRIADRMCAILHHNFLDLITMVEVLADVVRTTYRT